MNFQTDFLFWPEVTLQSQWRCDLSKTINHYFCSVLLGLVFNAFNPSFGFCTFVLLHLSSVNYREIPSCFHKKIKLHNYANLIFFLEEKYIMT